MNTFYHGDCLFVMKHAIAPESIDLIYLDPPFFTGKIQKGTTKWQPEAMEISFNDKKDYWGNHLEEMRREAPIWLHHIPRSNEFKAYLYYMRKRLQVCKQVLKPIGSIYLHCDWRASHYLKMLMDEIFGYANYQNDIVWEYYQGGKSHNRFGRKHDTIFYYTKGAKWQFNNNAVRQPYATSTIERYKTPLQDGKIHKLNPNGKIISDVWVDIHSISRSAKERAGYPTQKPEALLERIIKASSNEGDTILDPFCGCGTAIIVAHKNNRRWIGIDINRQAWEVILSRANQPSFYQWQNSFREATYVSHDLDEVKTMDAHEFERWANQFYKATKPSPEQQVDGITPEGIPIQTKTYKAGVNYNTVDGFCNNIQRHPKVPQPVKLGRIISLHGFDNSARIAVSEIEAKFGIKIELVQPEDLLPPIIE